MADKACRRVLIIEDDPTIAAFLEECLKNDSRFICMKAFGGWEGLELAKVFRPDLVVLDLLMPGMHGFDVCEQLRAHEDLKDVKILISTAKHFDSDRRTAMRLGADEFLSKPFSIQQFLGAVDRLLDIPR